MSSSSSTPASASVSPSRVDENELTGGIGELPASPLTSEMRETDKSKESEIGSGAGAGSGSGSGSGSGTKSVSREDEKGTHEEKKTRHRSVPVVKSSDEIAAMGPKESHATSESLFAFLCRLKAETFALPGPPEQSPIWICGRDDYVVDVFKGMITRNITAVPVLTKGEAKYYTFIDMMDLCKYVIDHFGKDQLNREKSFWDLVEEEKLFKTKKVDDLIRFHPLMLRNPYHPVVSGYSAFAVCEAMIRERRSHRVAIINNSVDRRMVNLVTQCQVVRFLYQHQDLLGPKKTKKVSECAQFFRPVISVKESSIVIDAFHLMFEKEIQGVAIVNDDGRLRGNLSLRDLKCLGSEVNLFWRLHQTCVNYVRKLRADYSISQHRPRTTIYLTPAATIEQVLKAIVDHDIHRLYICDSHATKKPVGIISLRDIIAEIIG